MLKTVNHKVNGKGSQSKGSHSKGSGGTDNACSPSTHGDPRVRRTRQLLEDAFRALIVQKPFESLSIGDITAHAMVNRATFYAHYTDKNDLAASVLRHDLRATVMQRFNERPVCTPENLVEIATAVFCFMEGLFSACPETASGMASKVGNNLQEELQMLIEHWVAQNSAYVRLFPGSSKATVASVISWSIYGAAVRWSNDLEREPVGQVCREVVAVLLPGARV
jgi:AcrR family transcriptional regulator